MDWKKIFTRTLSLLLTVTIVAVVLFSGIGRCARVALSGKKQTGTPLTLTNVSSVKDTLFSPDKDKLDPLTFVTFSKGNFLPNGFVKFAEDGSMGEAMILEWGTATYAKRKSPLLFMSAKKDLQTEMNKIDTLAQTLVDEGREEEANILFSTEYSKLSMSPYIIVVDGRLGETINDVEFSKLKLAMNEEIGKSDSILKAALDSGVKKAQTNFSDFFGDDVTIDIDFGELTIINESKCHITLSLGVKSDMKISGEVSTRENIVLLTILNLQGDIINIYSYSPVNDNKSLKTIASWLDNVTKKVLGVNK